jgi:valyl-tRNA synthetase
MAALAGHGRDIKFDLNRAEGYKNFCNKLWNATRFVLMNTEGAHFTGAPSPRTDAERWILAQLARVSGEAQQHFADYRFDLLAQSLYEFAWNSFCDWFVELAPYIAVRARAPVVAIASADPVRDRGTLAVGCAETRHRGNHDHGAAVSAGRRFRDG